MQITLKTLLAACASTLFVAACSTAPVDTAANKPDVRQGEQVNNICFQTQIRNWRALDHKSIIVEKGLNDEYKLDLIGSCDPQDAFTTIGLVSRIGGGSCLESGDKLVTDSRYDGSCSIQKIYKWNKDAGKTAAAVTAG